MKSFRLLFTWKILAILPIVSAMCASTGFVQAQPFAYVTNSDSDSVSVIDTSTNTVIQTIGVGSHPLGVAITPDGAFAYVSHSPRHNSVSVIDTSTNTVSDTIAVRLPEGIAITPDGAFAYVTSGSYSVSVIDTSTNTVIDTIDVVFGPYEIAITPDGAFAYVIHRGGSSDSDSVSVIDTSTNTVIDTIGLGSNPFGVSNPFGIAITPDGAFAYVTEINSSSVFVIDTSTNTVIDTIGVFVPWGVAITPDGAFAYVTHLGSPPGSVSVIDTSTNTVSDTIAVRLPEGIAITPDGAFAYVTNSVSNSVSVIDTSTNTVSDTIGVGDRPTGIAITPQPEPEPFAYVTNFWSHSVSVIDTSTNTVSDTIGLGSNPSGVAITPDRAFAYVTHGGGSNSVSVIDTSTNTVSDTIGVGDSPTRVAITPDGAFAYVTNSVSNSVSVIDTSTNTVSDTIGVGSYPLGVAITPDGAFAYVTHSVSNSVSVIDTSTNTVIDTIGVGSRLGVGIAITPDGAFAYVTHYYSNSVSVIDTSTNTVSDTIGVGSYPTRIAITPDGAFAYVTNSVSNSVSVIDTSTNTVIDTIGVGSHPLGVAITPDGAFAYVINHESHSVSVIDTSTNTVSDTIGVGSYPAGIAITPVTAPDVDGDGTADISDPCPADQTDQCDQNGSGAVEIDASSGGQLVTPDGNLSLDIPPGSLATDTTVSVTATDTQPNDPSVAVKLADGTGQGQIVAEYDLRPNGTTFNPPADLTIVAEVTSIPAPFKDGCRNVSDPQYDPNRACELTIYTLNESTDEYEPDPNASCSVATVNSVDEATCTTTISHFSMWALIAPFDSDGDGVPDLFPPEEDLCDSFPQAASQLVYGGNLLATTDSSGMATVVMQAQLTDGSATGIAGEVVFSMVGISGNYTPDCLGTTDASGVAECTLENVPPDLYTVTADFAEVSGCYDGSVDEALLVVYNADQPRATGGGFFYPDAESTLPALTTADKANFGFVVYINKQDAADGNLEFQYKTAGINLKSNLMTWYTVSSNKAMFQGLATINGEGVYTLRVHATDGDKIGQEDHFDIVIWEGIDTEADPVHRAKNELAGGNIVVHKK